MKDGRIVEHHKSVGAELEQGEVVLTVQIHHRTLNFKSPAQGRLHSIAPLATLPTPGDWLFSILVEEQASQPDMSDSDNNASSTTTGNKASFTRAKNKPSPTEETVSDVDVATEQSRAEGGKPKGVSWSGLKKPVRTVLAALLWLLVGSALAGIYELVTDDSPISGGLSQQRINTDDQAYASNATQTTNNASMQRQSSSDQVYQEDVRRCSLRDKSCDPDVHVLCQLKQGTWTGEDRWRNPIKSYMCAPQPVKFSNGMWRQGYADGTKACQKYFGEDAFLQASFSRNSGFTSSRENQSDKPAAACVDACNVEAGKFNKRCTGLPQS